MANDNSKLVAIISYITLIGWIIALVLHMNNKTKLGGFHIRQSLLLMIVSIVLNWIPVLGWIVSIVLLIFWIMGLISAIQGEEKQLPLIGAWAQNWFKGI
jgi:uncharacterized membrane protein